MRINLISVLIICLILAALAVPRVRVVPPVRIVADIEALTGGLAKEVSTWEVPSTATVGSALTFALSLTGRLLPKAPPTSATYSLSARLMGDSGTAIQSLSKETQPLGGKGPEWKWLVEPKDAGQRELRLSIDVCSESGMCRTHVVARTIAVERTLGQTLGSLASPLLALLAAGVGWLAKDAYDEWRAQRKLEAAERRKVLENLQKP